MALLYYNGVDILRDENVILKDVCFQQEKGKFSYIIGKVGSGKSSILKTIYCELPVTVGEAMVFDYNLSKIKSKQIPYLRRKLGIVFQDFQLLTDRSVNDNLVFVLKATGWNGRRAMMQRIETVLNQVGMQNKGYKYPHELSGGEQQRIVIARALLNEPEMIIADEPTGNLDPETGAQIVGLLHEISRKGTAVIMTTHNYRWVEDFPARTMKCENNRLITV
ncbi:MAG: ATP-binding cassette domain-containing protein [Dysgonamonadaceae bacterium]|jgi:cell division transport system ATP-binding protein|nr:ATP-binding cassette domain-containing protein [Dysgonamonadaceae bacterium]